MDQVEEIETAIADLSSDQYLSALTVCGGATRNTPPYASEDCKGGRIGSPFASAINIGRSAY